MNAFDYSKNGAIKLLRMGKGARALKYFTEALQYKPLNVDCLVNRSHCYLNDGNVEKALIDADLAFNTESQNPKAVYQKAEVHFLKGEFETALLLYHRGRMLRPDDDKFRVGILRSETGIKNCVGNKNIFPTNAMLSSPVLVKRKSGTFSKKPSHESLITIKGINTQRTIRELLNEISTDRIFLAKIMKDEDNRISKLKDTSNLFVNKRHGKLIRNCFCNYFHAVANHRDFNSVRIRQAAQHCINYLDPRLEFWQQHAPFYTRNKDKKKAYNYIPDKEKCEFTIHSVLLELVHIEMLEYQGDHLKVIEKANKIISILNEIAGIDKHDSNIILSDLYSIIGNCYMKLGMLTEAAEYHELDRANGLMHNIKDAVSRSMDYLGIIHSTKKEYLSAIKIWSSKNKLTVSNLESAWLFHEISRCYYSLGDFENTLKYASYSLEKANHGMDETWQLNSNILIAKAYHGLKRISESTEIYLKALEISKILKLPAVEDELNKLIQYNLLTPRSNEKASISRIRESVKTVTKATGKNFSFETNDTIDKISESNDKIPISSSEHTSENSNLVINKNKFKF